ncbi:MAG: hypothetical protein AB1Z98_40115 [Nannocystaceae bacterium]
MSYARFLVVLTSLAALPSTGCVDDQSDDAADADTTAGEVSPQYRACAANDDCEDPTPFCFTQLGVCMRACAVVDTCAEAPPEGNAEPTCALLEYDAQPYQVCLLSCSDAADCPEGMACAPVPECQDCKGSICQPQ